MNAILNENMSPLNQAVERLVAEHGLRAVMAEVARRLVRRRAAIRHPAVAHLSDHLLRDIGLLEPGVERKVPPSLPLLLLR